MGETVTVASRPLTRAEVGELTERIRQCLEHLGALSDMLMTSSR
ncbi:MAG: hypothetical protein ABSE77_08865 [Acidimicrobiales bacterium]|jgi:hypothetical protein